MSITGSDSTESRAPAAVRHLALPLFLAAIFASFLFRLHAVIVSDMDEGTYLYAGKLVAQGLTPYRDFLLAHPPLVVLLTGGWIRLFGADVMAARLAYIAVILVSTTPLYLVTRATTRSQATALLSIAIYTTGMLYLANMGRTVRLEPMMNAFLIGAFACCLLRPASLPLRLLAGALLAGALLVKFVAAVPAGLFVLGDVFWNRPRPFSVRPYLAMTVGFTLVLVPAGVWLLAQAGFVDNAVRSQLIRPGLPLHARLTYLRQDFLRYPPIPIALLAGLWFLLRPSDHRLRILALTALGGTLALVFAFRTFFGYYLVQVLPWLAVLAAVTAWHVARRLTQRWQPLLATGAVLLGVAAPLLYGEVYYRHGEDHVASPARIVPLLRHTDGYLYTMFPSFALWSGRELYPWYYQVDSLIPRITGKISDDDFIHAFAASQTLVLWNGELKGYPRAQSYVQSNFRLILQDSHYTLWSRDGTTPAIAP